MFNIQVIKSISFVLNNNITNTIDLTSKYVKINGIRNRSFSLKIANYFIYNSARIKKKLVCYFQNVIAFCVLSNKHKNWSNSFQSVKYFSYQHQNDILFTFDMPIHSLMLRVLLQRQWITAICDGWIFCLRHHIAIGYCCRLLLLLL